MMLPQQLRLFEAETHQSNLAKSDHLSFNDPAFASNKVLPIHRWVPWVAGFSSEFVSDVLTRYLDEPGVILDPFSGVGTTLVEAMLSGHRGIGFEINPYAALASRVKAHAYKIPLADLYTTITDFQAFYTQKLASDFTPKSSPPPGFRTRSAFYSPKVLRKVLIAQDFISDITHDRIRELFQLVFAATMVRYSNYSYEPSLGRRVSAGKEEILDFTVGEFLVEKLQAIAKDVVWLNANLRTEPEEAQIINETFFEYQTYLAPNSIDLIVTSPPYLNNYHYNRNTRPQLYWLGYVSRPKDMKPLAKANFGKYWQTVRQKERLDLQFSLPESDLHERLERLRQVHPEKGVYGGAGWANYAVTYFNDCYKLSQGIQHTLKSGSMALIVIGNSILQGILMPTDQYLGQIASHVGLELVDIAVPRDTRVGNSIIQSDVRVRKAKDSHQLYEAIVVLRKS